jgi:hypothetical protein
VTVHSLADFEALGQTPPVERSLPASIRCRSTRLTICCFRGREESSCPTLRPPTRLGRSDRRRRQRDARGQVGRPRLAATQLRDLEHPVRLGVGRTTLGGDGTRAVLVSRARRPARRRAAEFPSGFEDRRHSARRPGRHAVSFRRSHHSRSGDRPGRAVATPHGDTVGLELAMQRISLEPLVTSSKRWSADTE